MEIQAHKRRVRYKGSYPRNYQEKYKELNPEKYAATVAKVIQKGSTPVGMHISICVKEILEFLQIKPGQIGLDATLGYGGHSLAMLKCLEAQGHLFAIDVDPIESVKTGQRLAKLGYGSEILTIKQLNFANIEQITAKPAMFDFVLADLGISSMQVDNPERGFSYKKAGPLDLRLNPQVGIAASERLKTIGQAELKGMLVENADELYAEEIARAIVGTIKQGRALTTTTEIQEIISVALKFIPVTERPAAIRKSCQRTFQALRIDVNNEFEVLYNFLTKLPQVMAPKGRVAILTFHSGEDRLVKKSFKQLLQAGVYSEISETVIRPTAAECAMNPRARSTKMRWAIKA